MTTGRYSELLLRQDEVSECCFPSVMLFSRMAHMLKSETPWVKHPSAGCTRCCLCSSPSPERWVNPWRKWFWTCLRLRGFDPTGHGNKTLSYQRAVGGSPISERGTGPLAAGCIPEGLQMREPGAEASLSVMSWKSWTLNTCSHKRKLPYPLQTPLEYHALQDASRECSRPHWPHSLSFTLMLHSTQPTPSCFSKYSLLPSVKR